MELTEISLTLFFWSLQITIFRFIAVLVWNWAYRIVNFWVSVACFEVFSIMNLVQSTKMNIYFGILFGLKLQHFSNDAFQSCYDLFQVNWLVQTFVLSRKILECCLFFIWFCSVSAHRNFFGLWLVVWKLSPLVDEEWMWSAYQF